MKVAIFANTPAHVHLYKNLVQELEQRGHKVTVFARDYGCTLNLIEAYDIPHAVYGKCDTSKSSLLKNLPRQYLTLISQVRRFDPDLIFGMGAYASHAGAVSKTPTVLVLDSEPTQLDHLVSKPFADAFLTPDSFRRDLGTNHYAFPGFKECAYLHPDVFEPDRTVRSELGVGSDRFVVLRFNAFGSHHDVSKGGFETEQRRRLIEELSEYADVIVSDEGGDFDLETLPARKFDLPPERLHNTLAEASLLVADTQTMVTEAALLGTPSIRSNSFVGSDDMGNFIELSQRNLVDNLATFSDVQSRALEILQHERIQAEYQRRRKALFEEKINLTDLLVKVALNYQNIEQISTLSREWERPDLTGETTSPTEGKTPFP